MNENESGRNKEQKIKFLTVFADELKFISKSTVDHPYKNERELWSKTNQEPQVDHDLVGLSFSGGGIRSATFNLGLLQALGKYKLLKYVDYLSTVSGGGYIGSSLISLLTSSDPPLQLEGDSFPFSFPGGENERDEIKHLRDYSNYLAPRYGLFTLDTWRLITTYLTGLILVSLFPISLLCAITALLTYIPGYLPLDKIGSFTRVSFSTWKDVLVYIWNLLEGSKQYISKIHLWCGFIFLFLYLFRVLCYGFYSKWKFDTSDDRKQYSTFQAHLLLTVFFFWVFAILPAITYFCIGFQPNVYKTIMVLMIAFIPLLKAHRDWNIGWLKRYKELLIQIGMTIICVIIVLTIYSFMVSLKSFYDWWLLEVLSAIFLFELFLVDINKASLHYFYRDRLAKAYIFKTSQTQSTETSKGSQHSQPSDIKKRIENSDYTIPNDKLLLTNLYTPNEASGLAQRVYEKYAPQVSTQLSKFLLNGVVSLLKVYEGPKTEEPQEAKIHTPYLLINTTLNLAGDKSLSLRGRKSALFLFSKLYCGSEITSYSPTINYENGNIELATAMAVSGAALSSQMGQYSNGPNAFMMTLLNIRLGSWRQNPKYPHLIDKIIWPWYLLRELFNQTKATTRLCNISDGGHFENLGLFSLLQRKCKYIIVSDAGADKEYTFQDLENTLRKARIDLGIQIDIHLDNLRPDPNTHKSRKNWVTAEIQYPGGQTGILAYIKTSITGEEPVDILSYQQRNPNFPHESTSDQFFDEAQFESYRALGYNIGKVILNTNSLKMIMENQSKFIVSEIFGELLIAGK